MAVFRSSCFFRWRVQKILITLVQDQLFLLFMHKLFQIRIPRALQLLALIVIASASFWILSPWKSPFLNSDNAVHILMTYDCQLPDDLYYWGQDRLGSFIPMLGHFIYVVLNTAPPLAASIALYVILFSTVLLLSSFFKHIITRLLLSLVIFFPIHQVDYMLRLGHPYTAQFFFIALFLFLLKKFWFGKGWKKYWMLIGSCMALVLAMWSSDMTIVALIALLVTGIVVYMNDRKQVVTSLSPFLIQATLAIVVFASGVAFLVYARSVSRPVAAYDGTWIGSAENIIAGMKKYVKVYLHILIGWQGVWSAIHHWLLSGIVALSSVQLFKLIFRGKIPPMVLFFLLNFIGGECLLIISKWVALNNFNGWYQTYPYISLMICLLLLIDHADIGKARSALTAGMILLLLVSAISVTRIYVLKINRDFNERSLSELKDLRRLGRCGIIGDYWHSYLPAALNPETIKATPYEDGRSERCTDSVMACEKIYLIKDAWLEKFPQEYNAYGRVVYFSGDSLKLSDWELGLYLRRKKTE